MDRHLQFFCQKCQQTYRSTAKARHPRKCKKKAPSACLLRGCDIRTTKSNLSTHNKRYHSGNPLKERKIKKKPTVKKPTVNHQTVKQPTGNLSRRKQNGNIEQYIPQYTHDPKYATYAPPILINSVVVDLERQKKLCQSNRIDSLMKQIESNYKKVVEDGSKVGFDAFVRLLGQFAMYQGCVPQLNPPLDDQLRNRLNAKAQENSRWFASKVERYNKDKSWGLPTNGPVLFYIKLSEIFVDPHQPTPQEKATQFIYNVRVNNAAKYVKCTDPASDSLCQLQWQQQLRQLLYHERFAKAGSTPQFFRVKKNLKTLIDELKETF